MQRLHLTNGDAAGDRLVPLVAPEPVLPWRDMLHEGPVRARLDPATLRDERAHHLSRRYRLDPVATLRRFEKRDATMRAAIAGGDRFLLWFEHDLFDQLQLLQILDLLARSGVAPARIGLAQADHYLAELPDGQLAVLGRSAPSATSEQLALAVAVWAAFTAPTPEPLATMLARDLGTLRWLGPALRRLLDELPDGRSGLSCTERQMLEPLALEPLAGGRLYRTMRAREEPWFLGDWPFFAILDELAAGPAPLVVGPPTSGFPFTGDPASRSVYLEAQVVLTHQGQLVLAGDLDRAAAVPLDRWLGGTHLTGAAPWRWDPRAMRLCGTAPPRSD